MTFPSEFVNNPGQDRGGLAVVIVFRYPRATLRFALGHTLAPGNGGWFLAVVGLRQFSKFGARLVVPGQNRYLRLFA